MEAARPEDYSLADPEETRQLHTSELRENSDCCRKSLHSHNASSVAAELQRELTVDIV